MTQLGRHTQEARESFPEHPSRSHRYPFEVHRTRILWAATQLIYADGVDELTVARIIARAGVSRQTFYRLFRNREECVGAVLDEALALIVARVEPAYRSQARWVDGVRAAMLALLELLDERRELARFCLARATAVPGSTPARRKQVLDRLVVVLQESRGEPRAVRTCSPLAAEVVIGGALAVIQQRVWQEGSGRLVELRNPLMAMIVLPFLGAAAAQREASRPVQHDSFAAESESGVSVAAGNPLAGLDIRLTYRTIRVMSEIAAQAGLSNLEISRRAGIKDQGQISKMLTRLAGLGLVENTGDGQSKGSSNAWRLTPRGIQVEWAIGREIRTTGGMVPAVAMPGSGDLVTPAAEGAANVIAVARRR